MRKVIVYFFVSLILVTSCTINSHVMLKTPRDFVFDTPPEHPSSEYIISPNDILKFRLYSNDGFLIIDLSSGTKGTNSNIATDITYVVDSKGVVSMPILGEVKISGYTVKEAVKMLEEKYAEFYVDPFVQITVTNKRVIVFPGTGSDAKVVILKNNGTKLIEVLGYVGGISKKGRASRIKILREVDGKREIYLVDLSTIEGIKYADMIVQANDIIYVEPVPDIAREILADITPVLSLVSSTLLVIFTLERLKAIQ